jgi:hypothetical protein
MTGTLPSSFTTLVDLTSLDVSSNALTGSLPAALPPALRYGPVARRALPHTRADESSHTRTHTDTRTHTQTTT